MPDVEREFDPSSVDVSDLDEKYAITADHGFETFVVVDGLPIVDETKKSALTKVLKKRFAKYGTLRDDDTGFYMPSDENGKTKGFAFLEFSKPEEAAESASRFHMSKFDAKHTLYVNRLSDVDKYGVEGKVPDKYIEPEFEEFKKREHWRSWLTDPHGRDQMVLHKNEEVGVYWNRKGDAPEPVTTHANWTETYVRWSPRGTYLASIHRQGVQLRGGATFESALRFVHPGVRLIDFSPSENYLVTWSNEPITLPPLEDAAERARFPLKEKDEGNHIIVWDVRAVLPIRSFSMYPPTASNRSSSEGNSVSSSEGASGPKMSWPIFKWSSDDKYLARMKAGELLTIYETPSFERVGKESVKIPGIVDFEFSPALIPLEGNHKHKSHVLCYWTPEMKNQNARVSLMTIPSKEILRTRNLVNVSDCRLHWQDQGRFLCVKVDRLTKSKKSSYTNLEFFRLTEKDVPVEDVELKETVINLAWEPARERLVVISLPDMTAQNAPTGSNKFTVSFYALDRTKGVKGTWRCLRSEPRLALNSIYWSPKGRFVIVANVGFSAACEMQFWDFDHEIPHTAGQSKANNPKDKAQSLLKVASSEHYGMTDVEWDPSGRYVATFSSVWRHPVENGYKLWDFRGQLLREEDLDKFKALQWRPRPPNSLSDEVKAKILRNMDAYSQKFDEEDAMEASEASRELVLRRRAAFNEWKEWRASMEAKLKDLHLEVVQSSEQEVIEEVRTEFLEEKEEVV